MKMISEYLERSMEFERMAAEAADPALRAKLQEQAQAYYKLAAKRAKETGVTLQHPPPPSK